MPYNPRALQVILEEAAPPDMELLFKPLFGGILAYADDRPVAWMSDRGLALKVFGADHAALLATPSAQALGFDNNQRPSKAYVVVPEAMLDDPPALRAWIVRAAKGVAQAPKTRRR